MMYDGLMTRPRLTVTFISCEQALRSDRPLSIAADTVHVWGFGLEGNQSDLDIMQGWLDGEERSRASRLVDERDRLRYVLSHGALRALLSRYMRCRPDELRFGREEDGKPMLLQAGAETPMTFSMAHSHDRLAIAVTKRNAIGVDLEQRRPTLEVVKLADRFYRPSERSRLAGLTVQERARQFFRYWVAKEAVLKGEGTGLTSLQDCEVLAADTEDRATVRMLNEKPRHQVWTVQWLSCGRGWEGAVAYSGRCHVRVMPA